MDDSAEPQPHTSSTAQSVARAGGIMVASLFLSRVLGMVRSMIMAHQFGQTDFTDAYVLAFTIPDLLFYLISAGSISSVFIPVFTEYLHTGRERDAWKTFSVVATAMALLVSVFIALSWIYAPNLAHYVAGQKSEVVQANVELMSRIVVPTQFAFLVGGLVVGTLYARKVFAIPGLAPNIYNIGIIFGALVLSRFVTPGVSGMAWGALVGSFVGSLFLPLWMMHKVGGHYRPSLDFKDEGAKKVFKLMLPIIFGMSLPSIFPIITRYFMTYYPEGTNTAMEFSNQIMQAPLGVFGQSLALAVAPALSEFLATQQMDKFRTQFSLTLRNVIFLTVPFTALFGVFAQPIARALFEYGKSGPEDTARTAVCVSAAGIGVFAWCMQPVLMRGYFSLQNTIRPILWGTICTVLYLIGSYAVVSQKLPFYYLPAWASVCAIVLAILMYVDLGRQVGDLDTPAVLTTLGKSFVAAAVGGAVLWGANQIIPANTAGLGKLAAIGLIGLFATGFGWVYYFMARLLKMPETAYLDRALAKLDRRKKA